MLRELVKVDSPDAAQCLRSAVRLRGRSTDASGDSPLSSLLPIAVSLLSKRPDDEDAVDAAAAVISKALATGGNQSSLLATASLGAIETLVVCAATSHAHQNPHIWRALAAFAGESAERCPWHWRLAASGAPEAAARTLAMLARAEAESVPPPTTTAHDDDAAADGDAVAAAACRVLSLCVTGLGLSAERIEALGATEVRVAAFSGRHAVAGGRRAA